MEKRVAWMILWIVFVNLSHLSDGQQMSIPPQIKARLDKATTFEELQRLMTVVPSTSRTWSAGTSNGHGRSRGGGVGGVAPSAARNRQGTHGRQGVSVADVQRNLPVIESPVQSRDSCKLINVCVPLPLAEETGILLFPSCIELPQCLGGCCNRADNCKAVGVERVMVKYKRWRIVQDTGNGAFEFQGEDLIEMERHKNCSCGKCAPETPRCTDRHALVNCKCQCKDRDARARCDGEYQRWSEETCECKCVRSSCPSNTYFNKNTCSCERGGINFDEEQYDDNNNDNSRLDDEEDDRNRRYRNDDNFRNNNGRTYSAHSNQGRNRGLQSRPAP